MIVIAAVPLLKLTCSLVRKHTDRTRIDAYSAGSGNWSSHEVRHEMGWNVLCRVRGPGRRPVRRALEDGRSSEYRNSLDPDSNRDPGRHRDHVLGRQQRHQGKHPDRPEIKDKSGSDPDLPAYA